MSLEPNEGIVCAYTEKTNSLKEVTSHSRATREVESIVSALVDYIRVTRQLKPVQETAEELREHFINWLTTVGALEAVKGQSGAASTLSASADVAGPNNATVPASLRLLFAPFVSWLARERPETFSKVAILAEPGLVIDLVSEVRVPTRKGKKVSLSVVLDSRILLELIGLYGRKSQESVERLISMCKDYGVSVVTLVHLVEEVKEIAYNVLENPNGGFTRSVNEAIRLHPEVLDILRRVNASPDKAIRAAGVIVQPWTQVVNVNSTQFFPDAEVSRFIEALPYDKSKPTMARRDAQSLAFAVSRQNGARSSNAYEARCIILTRSAPFVGTAKRFLRAPPHDYPSYDVIPMMELRHFSTMFMISFGSEASRLVLRSELIASCDRVLRVSPDLTGRIRAVLAQVQAMPQDQIDAALEDPATLAEFALVTSNDPAVVTPHNSSACLRLFAVQLASMRSCAI